MSYDWLTNAARHASLHIKPEHTPAERTEIIVAKIKQVLEGETDLDTVREKYLESVIAAQKELIDKQSAFIHASQSPTNVGRTITEISKGVYSSGSRPGRVDEARVAEIVNGAEAYTDTELLDLWMVRLIAELRAWRKTAQEERIPSIVRWAKTPDKDAE